MATKTLKTRIKNRVDNLSNWFQTGVELLDGEIAIVRVPTGDTYVNPVTNKEEPVVELLMKVGATDSSGNCIAFENLPWMSAKASDVYDWAKEQDPSVVTVKYNKGTDEAPSWQESTLANILKDLETVEAAIATKADSNHTHSEYENQKAFGAVMAGKDTCTARSASDTIFFGGKNISFSATANAGSSPVQLWATVEDGSTETKGVVQLSDATDSEVSTTAATSKAVAAAYQKAADAAAVAAGKADSGHAHAGVYLPAATNYAGSDSQGGAATSAKKVENKLSITVGSGTATEFDGSGAKSISITLSDLGGASQEAVFGDKGLSTQVASNTSDIANLKTAVAGGVHFVGTVDSKPSSTLLEVGTHSVVVGDVVIYKGGDTDADFQEYICTDVSESAATWEVLGDVTRIGAIEKKVDDLDYEGGEAGTNKFVTKVTQTDGLIEATYARPTAADVVYSGTGDSIVTVATQVGTNASDIAGLKTGKADAVHEHSEYENQYAFKTIKVKKSGGGNTDVPVQADNTEDTVEFEGTNIKITGTNGGTDGTDKIAFEVANASDSVAGVVKLSDSVTFTDASPAPAATSGKTAATPKAVATAYKAAQDADAKAANALKEAQHSHPYLLDTTTYAASDSVGGDATQAKQVANSLTIQLNSGTNTTGNNVNKFVFNGSAEKTIDITPASIGAAAANHSHTDMSSAIADIEEDLAIEVVKYDATNQKLVVGTLGENQNEIMIIDCGGADGWD